MARSSPQVTQGHIIAGAGSRTAITKKLVLWSVLLLQLAFIACIWLLQMSQVQQESTSEQQRLHSPHVNFIKQVGQPKVEGQRSCAGHENVNRYEEDFYRKKTHRLNNSAWADYGDLAIEQLWCYREGTLDEVQQQREAMEMSEYQCQCASGWHGRDCGQPEIIWRALMTLSRTAVANRPLQLREASANALQRLFYVLELGPWEQISMEMFELQLRTLVEVVDYFLIYYVSSGWERLTYLMLERTLNGILAPSRAKYQLHQCRGNCSGFSAYRQFQAQLWTLCGVQMQASDLLLFGNAQTVFAPAALKFFKYYARDVLPLRFRLKHNVYGFYWQHPERTELQGLLSSFVHLQGDMQQLQAQAASYTLGDLNHYGGWSCEYCLPPEHIVRLLQSSKGGQVKLPNGTRGVHIDAAYLQQLIARGVYVDGSTQLLRLREQSEKYYAPAAAMLRGSQYAQLLVNLYDVDVLEDGQDEDEDELN